jgi:hypothetical protein
MSGTGRDAGGMNAGTSGSSSMGDRGLGNAEVHSGLHSGSGEQYSGLQFAGSEQDTSAAGRLRGVADAVRDRIPEGARNLGEKAGDATSGVRERLSGVGQRANRLMENRGMLDRLRENPLPVLGVAFAVGFLLSGGLGDDDDEFEPSRASSARRELRSALMAGVTAGIAQGARGFLGEASAEGGSFLNTLLDGLMGNKGGGSSGATGGSGGTGRSGGGAGGSGAGSYGGSTGGASGGISRTGGRPGGTGSTGGSGAYSGGGSTGGSTGGSRPPSHQEY